MTIKSIFITKLLVHFGALCPLIVTYYQAINDQYGADPVQALMHFTGIGAFNLLLISLIISPLAKQLKQGQLIPLRRPLGLYAFTYALCHVTSYFLFELQLEWTLLLSEIIKRPYITVGFTAFTILFALAITSIPKIRIQMGRNWQKLHNWVYAAAMLIAFHYIWSVKSELLQPIMYLVLLIIILSFRQAKIMKKFKLKKSNEKT